MRKFQKLSGGLICIGVFVSITACSDGSDTKDSADFAEFAKEEAAETQKARQSHVGPERGNETAFREKALANCTKSMESFTGPPAEGKAHCDCMVDMVVENIPQERWEKLTRADEFNISRICGDRLSANKDAGT